MLSWRVKNKINQMLKYFTIIYILGLNIVNVNYCFSNNNTLNVNDFQFGLKNDIKFNFFEENDSIKKKLSHSIELQLGGNFLVGGFNYCLQFSKNNHYFVSGTGFSYISYLGLFSNQYLNYGKIVKNKISVEIGFGYTLVYDKNGQPSSKEARLAYFNEYFNGGNHAPYYAKYFDILYATFGVKYTKHRISYGLNFQSLYSYIHNNEKQIFPKISFNLKFHF